MANKKITELNEATSVSGNDLLVIVDVANDETKKVPASKLGGNIPIQDTAPQNPRENDLWIDISENNVLKYYDGIDWNNVSYTIVSNAESNSTTDTYSCNYINGIIESGSNANGYYTKYADGTLICRHSVGPITTNANAGTTTPVTFPYEFVDTNWQIQLTMTNGQAFWSYVFANAKDKTKTGFGLDTWNNSGGTNSGQYFDYIAIGRWK